MKHLVIKSKYPPDENDDNENLIGLMMDFQVNWTYKVAVPTELRLLTLYSEVRLLKRDRHV